MVIPEETQRPVGRVNPHTPGMSTSFRGRSTGLTFTPLVYTPDTDRLGAGVWLTIPYDPGGDFAIGAFANRYQSGASPSLGTPPRR